MKYDERIVAHRGANNASPGSTLTRFPENTLLALLEAYRVGVRFVECDVSLTADGKLIVFHDDTLRWKASYHRKMATTLTKPSFDSLIDMPVWDLSYCDVISQVDVGGAKVPLLNEFLDCLVGHPERGLIIELKGGEKGLVEAVAKLVAGYRSQKKIQKDQLMFMSFDFEMAKAAKASLPDHRHLMLTTATPNPVQESSWRIRSKQDLQRLMDSVCGAKLDGMAVEYDAAVIDADFIASIQARGLIVLVWNYEKDDTVEAVSRILQLGVDFVNTNSPEHFI